MAHLSATSIQMHAFSNRAVILIPQETVFSVNVNQCYQLYNISISFVKTKNERMNSGHEAKAFM